jgi:hypothetical protein
MRNQTMKHALKMCLSGLTLCLFLASCAGKNEDDTAWSLGILAFLAQAGSSTSSGGAYTAFGTSSCAAGWTAAYTGRAYVHGVNSGGAGAVFCSTTTGQYLPFGGGAGSPFLSPVLLNGSGANLECAICVR